MQASRRLCHFVGVVSLLGGLLSARSARAYDPGIVVNSTADTIADDGQCTLREAIAAANTNTAPASTGGECVAGSSVGTDVISFSISGAVPLTITLGSQLQITSPVTIDGSTQTGFDPISRVPVIQLSSASQYLLVLGSGATGSSLSSLAFIDSYPWDWPGVDLEIGASNVHVTGCYFNTDGTSYVGSNSLGMRIDGSENVIGGPLAADRNMFGGDGMIVGDGKYNEIQGNYLGVTSGGNAKLAASPSGAYGIRFWPFLTGQGANTVRGNVIDGYQSGIEITSASDSNIIAGNIVGLGADGSTVLGNQTGIEIYNSSGNVIGGVSAADRNVISGNIMVNVEINGIPSLPADNNVVEGNFIGTVADGLSAAALPPGRSTPAIGIDIETGSGNQVGGTAPGSGNVISGNSTALAVTTPASGTVIRGNLIGTDKDGAFGIVNNRGIQIAYTTADVGSALTPGRNVIGASVTDGIMVAASSGTTIYGNRIGLAAHADLSRPNGVGITLTQNAAATIAGNWIAHSLTDGIYISADSTVAAGSSANCFSGNGSYGVDNQNIFTDAPFADNWWGSVTGPTNALNPSGTGDAASFAVTFSPFLASRAPVCRLGQVRADFDGSGTTDVSDYRPSTRGWFIKDQFSAIFGAAGDDPVPADYDGNGSSDVAVFRPSNASWYVRNQYSTFFGMAGDVPVPGDYNGDGTADLAVFRPSTAAWYVKNQFATIFGLPGDIPIPGDYNGDGTTDVAVYRPSTHAWFVKNQYSAVFGLSGDIPVPGDYNADGITDIAVYRPSTSAWYVRNQSSTMFGLVGDIPVPGDYNGDGSTDIAVYRASSSGWFVRNQFSTIFGIVGDYPLPAPDTNADGVPYQ